jgi:hypothetical protein
MKGLLAERKDPRNIYRKGVSEAISLLIIVYPLFSSSTSLQSNTTFISLTSYHTNQMDQVPKLPFLQSLFGSSTKPHTSPATTVGSDGSKATPETAAQTDIPEPVDVETAMKYWKQINPITKKAKLWPHGVSPTEDGEGSLVQDGEEWTYKVENQIRQADCKEERPDGMTEYRGMRDQKAVNTRGWESVCYIMQAEIKGGKRGGLGAEWKTSWIDPNDLPNSTRVVDRRSMIIPCVLGTDDLMSLPYQRMPIKRTGSTNKSFGHQHGSYTTGDGGDQCVEDAADSYVSMFF